MTQSPLQNPSDERILVREMSCIFSPAGELLWCSPKWNQPGAAVRHHSQMLGTRWQEFVHAADLPRLLAWFADASKKKDPAQRESTIDFCAQLPSSTRMAKVRYWKHRYGANWLVLGRMVEMCPNRCNLIVKCHELPAPPCLFASDHEHQ